MCQAQHMVPSTQEKARGKVSAFRILGVQWLGASVQTELWEFKQMNTAGGRQSPEAGGQRRLHWRDASIGLQHWRLPAACTHHPGPDCTISHLDHHNGLSDRPLPPRQAGHSSDKHVILPLGRSAKQDRRGKEQRMWMISWRWPRGGKLVCQTAGTGGSTYGVRQLQFPRAT